MSKNKSRYLFFGAIFGFIMGLLFAPKKGSEFRKNIKHKIDDIKEDPKTVLDETINNIKENINNFMDSEEDDAIEISEDEIIISKIFDDEGNN